MLRCCIALLASRVLISTPLLLHSLRDIDIAFDFVVDFDAEDSVAMQTAAMTSGSGQANVDSYVSACKCDDLASFACNSDPVTPSSILNVCIQSMDADVEIAFLNRLELFQSNVLGDQTLIIVDGLFLQNAEISSMTIKNATAVGVSTVVPSRFFSYGGLSTATVSGVVQVKFVGSRRLVSLPFGAAGRGGGVCSRDAQRGRCRRSGPRKRWRRERGHALRDRHSDEGRGRAHLLRPIGLPQLRHRQGCGSNRLPWCAPFFPLVDVGCSTCFASSPWRPALSFVYS